MSVLKKIIEKYPECVKNTDIVYKLCLGKYLVIMAKTLNTITNEARHGVKDPAHAKFRANHLMVLHIIDIFDLNNTPNCIINTHRVKRDILSVVYYEINKIVRPDHFDINIDVVCSGGIHYFKSVGTAFNYNRTYSNAVDDPNNVWRSWHEDGTPIVEHCYLNGKRSGLQIENAWNGRKEYTLVNGCFDKTYRKWYSNGQLELEYNYADGKINGCCKQWDSFGTCVQEDYYVNNVRTKTS